MKDETEKESNSIYLMHEQKIGEKNYVSEHLETSPCHVVTFANYPSCKAGIVKTEF